MSKQTEQIILIAIIAIVALKVLSKASTTAPVQAVSSGGTSFDLGGDISDGLGIISDFD